MRPDDHRRKWDRSEYQKLALDRLRSEKDKKKTIESDSDDEGDDDSKGSSVGPNDTMVIGHYAVNCKFLSLFQSLRSASYSSVETIRWTWKVN